jgi:hypothetical protein
VCVFASQKVCKKRRCSFPKVVKKVKDKVIFTVDEDIYSFPFHPSDPSIFLKVKAKGDGARSETIIFHLLLSAFRFLTPSFLSSSCASAQKVKNCVHLGENL